MIGVKSQDQGLIFFFTFGEAGVCVCGAGCLCSWIFLIFGWFGVVVGFYLGCDFVGFVLKLLVVFKSDGEKVYGDGC